MDLVACLQTRCGPDPGENFARIEALAERAARAGARLVATPENSDFLGPSEEKVRLAGPVDRREFGELARRLGVWLLVGSVAERLDDRRCHNTSLLFSDTGELQAFYRKIHLFDVDVPGARFQESAFIAPGRDAVVADTPFGKLGMSVCYDVRFPALYAQLVQAGAELIAVPSAFTLTTGKDHWHVLLRARAIETQCWVLAPAQEGGARQCYGHTLIADPWGVVLAECGEGEGIALAEVDPERLRRIRMGMPVAMHRRPG